MLRPEPDIRWHPELKLWELRATVEFCDARHGRCITVPAGFLYDLSSIPRIVWGIISKEDLGTLAPLIHDWLYRYPSAYTKAEADRVFSDIMEEQEVSTWRRRAAYRAVRWFGRGWWTKQKQ